MFCPISGKICDLDKNYAFKEHNVCNQCPDITLIDLATIPVSINLINKYKELFEQKNKCECGLTLEDIKKLDRLGCEKCYETFKQFLLPILIKYQGDLFHCGKQPKNIFRQNNLKSLEEKLETAIKEERYEDAAVINEAIKQLKNAGQQN